MVSTTNNTKQVNNIKQPKGWQAVIDFFIEKGFNADEGKKFFEHYETRNWQTSDGKQIRDWRALATIGWTEQNYLTKKTNQTKNKRPKSRTTCEPLKTKTMDNPSKITEGGVEYSLGKFDGKSVLYDFPKILIYLNAKGKLLFGKKFRIYEEDRIILLNYVHYFIKDKENCAKVRY